ncbi:GDP-D-glucose phosphorylase 1 [Ctenocephalides felis]|uniref:GDP-D-glucose phosphorylase 1 n=1 Tax=Ctenocephalides felis TaxID=7515 RepID=UPI000E6E4FE2|nr:GDP-D-glucose phosphorylase 1 [Ctenocephalides felis]
MSDSYYNYDSECMLDVPNLNCSPISDQIIKKWLMLQEKNVFNYKLMIDKDKVLPGQYAFYIQLNTDRNVKRRIPQSISSLTQPFDKEKFNFTKIPPEEILFDIVYDKEIEGTIIINASPLTIGHCLYCPSLNKCLPQVLTKTSIEAAVRLMWLGNNRDLRMGYNSLGALASVNHLHFHLLFVDHRLAIENVSCKNLCENIYELVNYPAHGFCLEVKSKSEISNVCSTFDTIIKLLIDLNIPHNIFMTFGKTLNETCKSNALRILIFPRKDSFGCKLSLSFNLAFCELSGYIPVGNLESFNTLTEEAVTQILEENTSIEFNIVRDVILKSNLGQM